MDAPKRARVLHRNRSVEPSQPQRGARHIVIPMTREQFDQNWQDSSKMCPLVDRLLAECPELFPSCLLQGYALHGFARPSKKRDGLQLRKIRPKGSTAAFHLRPSFVLSYMTATTDAVEFPLLLASLGVPCWVLTQGFGQSAMYWQRLVERLGRNSLVGTTVRAPQRLPKHLVADEHPADWNGAKG